MNTSEGTLPTGRKINEVTWETVTGNRGRIAGWVYPKRLVSQFVPLFPKGQQLAISFWIIASLALVAAGIILPFFMGAWWLLLILAGLLTWKANRMSLAQFFVENLQTNKQFYDALRQTGMGDLVSVVFKD